MTKRFVNIVRFIFLMLLLAFLAGLMFSCSPEFYLDKTKKHYPELFQEHKLAIQDTTIVKGDSGTQEIDLKDLLAKLPDSLRKIVLEQLRGEWTSERSRYLTTIQLLNDKLRVKTTVKDTTIYKTITQTVPGVSDSMLKAYIQFKLKEQSRADSLKRVEKQERKAERKDSKWYNQPLTVKNQLLFGLRGLMVLIALFVLYLAFRAFKYFPK